MEGRGELKVRYKLGVLKFDGMEYLYGNQSQIRSGASLEDDFVAGMAKKAGLGNQFSVLYSRIGAEAFQNRNVKGAKDAFRVALLFNPDDRDAGMNLQRLESSYRPR